MNKNLQDTIGKGSKITVPLSDSSKAFGCLPQIFWLRNCMLMELSYRFKDFYIPILCKEIKEFDWATLTVRDQ